MPQVLKVPEVLQDYQVQQVVFRDLRVLQVYQDRLKELRVLQDLSESPVLQVHRVVWAELELPDQLVHGATLEFLGLPVEMVSQVNKVCQAHKVRRALQGCQVHLMVPLDPLEIQEQQDLLVDLVVWWAQQERQGLQVRRANEGFLVLIFVAIPAQRELPDFRDSPERLGLELWELKSP